jgi:DNA polymerase III delta subunit
LLDSGENEWSIAKKTGMHEYRVGIYKKSAMKRNMLRLKKLLALCCEADIKLKSTSLDDYSVLDKLVILASVK